MFHTAIASEPAAWLSGLFIGWVAAFCAQVLGASPQACIGCGSGAALLASLVVGTPINVAMLDVLSILVLRPLTGWGLWHATGAIARAMAT